jgi:hypothetical protein
MPRIPCTAYASQLLLVDTLVVDEVLHEENL